MSVAALSVGFRPMFLAAACAAVIGMALWTAVLHGSVTLLPLGLSGAQWHAHEMIYGYATAVVSGFLLTAAREWTGRPTATGPVLLLMVALWLTARLALPVPQVSAVRLAALADLAFLGLVLFRVARPIITARKWAQLGIVSKLALLGIGNAWFYLGQLGLVEQGVQQALRLGLYLLLALVLTLAGRLLPLFTRLGAGYAVEPVESRALTLLSLLLFLPFFLIDTFGGDLRIAAAFAVLAGGLNLLRLWRWYTPGIWRNPLLWSLHLSYLCLCLSFLLYGAEQIWSLLPNLALHGFAVGGIGLMTASMMMRVALGHTGRNVRAPPRMVALPLVGILVALAARVPAAALAPEFYGVWMLIAGTAWSLAFLGVLVIIGPLLLRERLP